MKRIRALVAGLIAVTVAGCAFASGSTSRGSGEGVELIRPGGARTLAPYSPAVRANGFVFFSGQIGIRGGEGLVNGVAEQTRQALANLETLMRAAGVGRADIVKCTVFLADIRDYDAMNEAYGQFFGDRPPARSAIGVSGLPAGARVEVECMARVPD